MITSKLIKYFFLILLFKQSLGERELIFVYKHARLGARGPSAKVILLFLKMEQMNMEYIGVPTVNYPLLEKDNIII